MAGAAAPPSAQHASDVLVASAYSPTLAEKAAFAQWRERSAARLPALKLVDHKLVHDHPEEGVAQIVSMTALGLTTVAEYRIILQQAAAATRRLDGEIDVDALNTALGMAAGMAPKNSTEAMLAIQMAVIHNATMVQARRLHGAETLQQLEANSTALNKLARTFSLQAETMKKLRSGGPQRVIVEHRHYHLHQGPDAPGGGGVDTEKEHQPDVRIPERETVLGYLEADGEPVPRAGSDRV